MCKRRIGYNADDVVPFMGMDEHQNSGGEGGWRKERDQAGWIYQLVINTLCAQDNPASTTAAFASPVVKGEPLALTKLEDSITFRSAYGR
jgi:hypothetical protein